MDARRRRLLAGAGALATTPFAAPVSAQSAPLIKVATFVPEQSVGVSRVIRPWMNAAQQEVGAKARFQGFWGGSLGKDAFKQFDLVRAGVADVAWILPAITGASSRICSYLNCRFYLKTRGRPLWWAGSFAKRNYCAA